MTMKPETFILAVLLFAASVRAEEETPTRRGEKVTLDASRSIDPEGRPLTFEWKQVSGPVVVLYDSTGPRPYFHAEEPGIYVFSVRASDGEDFSPWKKVTVEVKGADQRPVAVAGSFQKGRVGRYFVLDGRASRDPEGADLSYMWEQMKGPERLIPAEGDGRATLRLRARRPGTFIFRLRVNDGRQWSDPAEVRIDVLPPNSPPQLVISENLEVFLPEPVVVNRRPVAVVKPGGEHRAGDWLILDGSASYDLDGDALGFFWYQEAGPGVRELRQVKGMAIVRFRPEQPGEYRFRLVVSDGREDSEPARVTHRVASTNSPPEPVVDDDLVGRVAHEVVIDATRSVDEENDPLQFRWKQVSGPPIRDFIIFEGTNSARVGFTPREPGRYELLLSLSDGVNQPVEKNILVKVLPENSPPRLLGPDTVLLQPGRAESLPLQAVDADGDDLSITHAVLSGKDIRIIDGAPLKAVADAPGEYLVRFFVRDDRGGAARRDVLLHVIDPSGVPVLSVRGPESAAAFETIELAADLRDAEARAVRWRWSRTSGPPLFLLPSSADGPVLHVAAPPGIYRLRARAELPSGVNVEGGRTIAVAGGRPPSSDEAQKDLLSADPSKRARAAAFFASMGPEAVKWLDGLSISSASADATRDIRALRLFILQTFSQPEADGVR